MTVVGAVILTVYAAAAVVLLGEKVSDNWRAFPQFIDWTWLLVVVGTLAAAAVGLVGKLLRLPRHRLAVGLALAAGLRLGASLLIDAPLDRDWEQYHRFAERIAKGGDIWSNIPTGYSMVIAIPYSLFGPQPWIAEIANVVFGVATAWLVYRVALSVFGEPAAVAALFLFAIAPTRCS